MADHPFGIEPSPEIASRIDFPLLAAARGYRDAVEVGVDQGVFAKTFLDRWPGHWLIGIDPYEPTPELPYDRTSDLWIALQALAPHHGRFRLIREHSPKAVPLACFYIKPDFVYLDGSHTEADVAADLRAWWEVLQPGGMLAGHDFDEGHPGVVAAVTAFGRERGRLIRTTHETDCPRSWYIYKNEPEQLIHCFFRSGASPNPRVQG